jgi:hypothetical protein
VAEKLDTHENCMSFEDSKSSDAPHKLYIGHPDLTFGPLSAVSFFNTYGCCRQLGLSISGLSVIWGSYGDLATCRAQIGAMSVWEQSPD